MGLGFEYQNVTSNWLWLVLDLIRGRVLLKWYYKETKSCRDICLPPARLENLAGLGRHAAVIEKNAVDLNL